MSCTDKIKSIAVRKGIKTKDISSAYDMSYNSFNNKLRDCETRFNIRDLVKYAEICGLKVAFVDENNYIIEKLTSEDLKKII
ncbi:hypothetical protein [Thomasclavelia cocleata]|uniref:hypothetical protein n=1 Tax=Thomasclavelia cocleata TaxID=69824 RepID=UPI00256FCCF1|nr:hypothetical protein [Thomasclavelia cocleata]